VIEEIVAAALERGRLKKRQRRRLMSYPLVIRLMIAMTLDAGRVVLRVAGEAGRAARGHPVRPGMAYSHGESPSRTGGSWCPADLLEALFWQAAGPLVSDDEPSAVLLPGWPYALPTGCW